MNKTPDIINIRLSDNRTHCIAVDQTALPNKLSFLKLQTPQEFFDAIRTLQLRGAPCLGISAGYALYCAAQLQDEADDALWRARFRSTADFIRSARPTAVNLEWACQRMVSVLERNPDTPPRKLIDLLGQEADAIRAEDEASCRAISEFGLTLLTEGKGVLTVCNAGPLATSRYGTALGPLLLAKERGLHVPVFACETRPLLQGARLTAWELQNAGIDVTLICDNMAASVMANGWVSAVFAGCDRVAANGDAANKVGTSMLAILAKHFGIPFYILGPSSTFDAQCPSGKDICIEQRDPEEIRSKWYKEPMAPAGIKCYNPAFDVTDHSLISGFVTDRGIVHPPFTFEGSC